MPMKPPRICGHAGCLNLTQNAYCAEHEAAHQSARAERDRRYDSKRESRSKRGYSRKWYEYRKAFLARNPWCADCLDRGEYAPASEIDHIVPHKGDKALFWDTKNHQGLCKSCHSRKTVQEINAAHSPRPRKL